MSDTFRIENGVGFIGSRPIENAEVFVTDAVIPDLTFHTRNIRCKFNNGYELSIVFGDATYSENSHTPSDYHQFTETPKTAEVAVFSPAGYMIDFDKWGDTVLGYQNTDEVWNLYKRVEALPGEDGQ